MNLQLWKIVIGSGSHISAQSITAAQHSGQLCSIRVNRCQRFRSFTICVSFEAGHSVFSVASPLLCTHLFSLSQQDTALKAALSVFQTPDQLTFFDSVSLALFFVPFILKGP